MLTKAMAMFNDLSSSISNLSVQMKDLDHRQGELEKGKRKRSDQEHSYHPEKKSRHDISDSEIEYCGEERDYSDGELSDHIESLLGNHDKSGDDRPAEQDQWLEQFEADFVNEEVRTPPVSGKLAHPINKILSKKFDDDKIKSKMDSFPAPENVQGLMTPKVNPEVWGKLKTETRSRDVKLQKVQTRLIRGMTAMVMVGEKITVAQRENKQIDLHDCLKLTLNAVALVANGSYEVSLRRREYIRPDLNSSYRDLWSNNTPITDTLFGDDLPKVVKEINETNRMALLLSKRFWSWWVQKQELFQR